LLGQKLKDTLCGLKVLFRQDYEAIAKNRAYFGEFDPFGDFDLIFGAAKLNLRMVDSRSDIVRDLRRDQYPIAGAWLAALRMVIRPHAALKFVHDGALPNIKLQAACGQNHHAQEQPACASDGYWSLRRSAHDIGSEIDHSQVELGRTEIRSNRQRVETRQNKRVLGNRFVVLAEEYFSPQSVSFSF